MKAFTSEYGIPVTVRVAQANVLHDRYAIDDSQMLHFGNSLNGIGAKQSFVVSLGEDIRMATIAAFDKLWGNTAKF